MFRFPRERDLVSAQTHGGRFACLKRTDLPVTFSPAFRFPRTGTLSPHTRRGEALKSWPQRRKAMFPLHFMSLGQGPCLRRDSWGQTSMFWPEALKAICSPVPQLPYLHRLAGSLSPLRSGAGSPLRFSWAVTGQLSVKPCPHVLPCLGRGSSDKGQVVAHTDSWGEAKAAAIQGSLSPLAFHFPWTGTLSPQRLLCHRAAADRGSHSSILRYASLTEGLPAEVVSLCSRGYFLPRGVADTVHL